jgi:hypothetical protein
MATVPRDDNNTPLATVAAQGYVTPATTNASATSSGTDYFFAWVSAVNHVMICNKTGANVYYEFDAPASLGSPAIGTTYGGTVIFDVRTTVLHLYTAAGQNVNGSVDANIVVRGWM